MRDNTLNDIKAAVNVFRFVADMISDLATLEKEYDFKFTELGQLLTRIKFNDIIKGNDVELLKSIVMFLPLQKLLEEFPNVFNYTYSQKRDFAERLNDVCNHFDKSIGRGNLALRARNLDPQLWEKCNGKNYHDTLTNAITLLEDRIREKTKLGREHYGAELIDLVFSSKDPKLIVSNIEEEQKGVLLLFKGVIAYLRNPAFHSLSLDQEIDEALKIAYFIDILLKIVDRSKLV